MLLLKSTFIDNVYNVISFRFCGISVKEAKDTLLASAAFTLAVYLLAKFSCLLWDNYALGLRDPNINLPLPPGNMGWPFLGESHHFINKGAAFFTERHAKYGDIYKTHILGRPMIRVSGASNIRSLLNREPHQLTMSTPTSAKRIFGEQSVAVVTGQKHRSMKKKLSTCVTYQRLVDYIPCIQETMRSHILSWCSKEEVLGFMVCEELMCDIMLEIALGWRKEHDVDGQVRAAFLTINRNLISLPVKIPGGGFYKAIKAKKIIVDFVKKRLYSKGDKDHVCMLDILLISYGEEEGLTEEEIIDNTVTFLLAGTGTTSSALSSSLMMLGKHPEVLTDIRKELDSKGLLNAESGIDLNYELIQSLDSCQSVCKEVLRLHPPVGGSFRQAQTTLDVGGYRIPKEWKVMYGVRETQFSTTVFENREMFFPQRWMDKTLEETLRTSASCSYMPFGSGPRLCLGKSLALMEMTIFLVELARLVMWKLHNPNAKVIHLPVTKANDNLPVSFTRRS
ncbi:unnamed protein product [Candidula unifasciata]|uniref:Cytochrome P450 n=1 Tax=Candidula unifasciata TaxID=100452 RepID=A0A8S4A0M8_9EUPU|nr:unnamed protein product [Candidula unifasciata]